MAKEYIEKSFGKFEDHLSLQNNKRIIFSGKFGIGKSFFLKEFFEEKKYNDKYIPIFLNPVNYSISSNEDIFELIKFDILYQILDKELINFENFDFSTGNLLYQYFSNKLLNDFFSTVDDIGEKVIDKITPKYFTLLKNLGKLVSKISEIGKKDYEKFKREIEENPDLIEIGDFFEKEMKREGSHYENNSMTQIIKELILNIKNNYSKEIVLVIDDLDRIDPEHIFRILNILSAQDIENENKFGFEKIILVCDIKNIKSIYHHFYGQETDFFGYINKFYSLEVYVYSNKDYVKWFDQNFTRDSYGIGNVDFLGYIFSDAISKNFISARQIFHNDFSRNGVENLFYEYSEQKYEIIYKNKRVNHFSLFQSSYALLQTIVRYFGNSSNFLKYLETLENNQLGKFQNIIGQLYFFIDFKKEINKDLKGNVFKTLYNFDIICNYDRFELGGDFNSADLKTFFLDILNQFQEIKEQ